MNTIRLGKISSINYNDGCADVVFEDADDSVVSDLPFFSTEYQMPDIGDLVVVTFRNDGSGSDGYILGKIFNERDKPEGSGKGNYFKRFSKDSFMKYDSTSGTLTISAPHVIIDRTNEGGGS